MEKPDFIIKEHTVYVWQANLNKSANEVAEFHVILSEDEKQRAARFHFDKDRNSFIVARGVLRQLLSQYIAVAPQEIIFSYSDHGKPAIDQKYNLQFNVSHSQDIALYAFAHELSVGIDIEYKERECNIDNIVESYFSPNEANIIKNLNGAEKIQAFFNGWARKEAFLKALGQGLSYSLDKVEVTLTPDQPAQFIALHDTQLNINDWHLHTLELVENYAAALVVKGTLQDVKIMEYQSSHGQEKQRWQDTLEALEDIRMGRVIDGNKVRAWLKNWGTEKESKPPKR